jgi:hypothetical protein
MSQTERGAKKFTHSLHYQKGGLTYSIYCTVNRVGVVENVAGVGPDVWVGRPFTDLSRALNDDQGISGLHVRDLSGS